MRAYSGRDQYNISGMFKNGHFNTIYSSFLRKSPSVNYRRQQIPTEGGYLDLDWSTPNNSKELVILSHGLEGNTQAKYILGMVNYFNQNNVDALAWNYSTCAPEGTDKQNRFYHSGSTLDLYTILDYVKDQTPYESVYLIGFSMGGNIILKYLGEPKAEQNPLVKSAVAISVPLDLKSSAHALKTGFNMVYTINFLRTLKAKVRERKDYLRSHGIDADKILKVKNLNEFDELFTAPYYGFKDANDYYDQVSAIKFLPTISTPTLIVNALDDPFLTQQCFPYELIAQNPLLHFETPMFGGHLGFFTKNPNNVFWTEKKSFDFTRRHTEGLFSRKQPKAF